MKFLDHLDRIVRPIAIPKLTEILVAGQVVTLLLTMFDPKLTGQLTLVWSKVLGGEVWRLISFLFSPPEMGLFVIIYFFLFLFLGRTLEEHWGTVRYNAYFYLGALLTLACAALLPQRPFTGLYFEASLFLAFATVYPHYELLVMLVIPIKVKWLAMFQGAMYLLVLFSGFTPESMMVLASIGNYLIFFAGDLIRGVTRGRTRAKMNANDPRKTRSSSAARHRCVVCGVNSKTHPFEDFRYCSKCDGELAYCEVHLHEHEHQTTK